MTDSRRPESLPPPGPSGPLPAPPHVLVVDDLVDNRDLLVQLLEDDYRVTEAANGREAIAAIERDRPDLLLLDLMMPVLDGFGVLDYLRAHPDPFLPVVVVSAATERDSRLRALREGAHEFVTKPVDGEELLVRVRTLLALKASKDALECQNERLEDEVARRTEEIAQAFRRLEQADRYKDEFLAVVSHELRTPLNFITGFGSLLADEEPGPLNDEQRHYVSRIMHGADLMLGLVNDLLDVAKLEAGRFDLDPQPIRFALVVDEVIGVMKPLADDKGIALETEIDVPGEPAIDGLRVVQILTNLVSNAIKFTPRGGRIAIRARLDGDALLTEVVDSGVGIAPEDLARIFEKFQQGDMSKTRRAGGTGLGLAITKALVEAHGGRIGVLSQPGHGSTFWFSLPTRPPAVPAVPASGAASRAARSADPALRPGPESPPGPPSPPSPPDAADPGAGQLRARR